MNGPLDCREPAQRGCGHSWSHFRGYADSRLEDDVFLVGLTWESLGVLVFRREVALDIADFFSGAIVISWRKLGVFVEADRRALERDTVWEWFQWLAERMIEREAKSPPMPAHIAHRAWTR